MLGFWIMTWKEVQSHTSPVENKDHHKCKCVWLEDGGHNQTILPDLIEWLNKRLPPWHAVSKMKNTLAAIYKQLPDSNLVCVRGAAVREQKAIQLALWCKLHYDCVCLPVAVKQKKKKHAANICCRSCRGFWAHLRHTDTLHYVLFCVHCLKFIPEIIPVRFMHIQVKKTFLFTKNVPKQFSFYITMFYISSKHICQNSFLTAPHLSSYLHICYQIFRGSKWK